MIIIREAAKNWNIFGQYAKINQKETASWQLDSTPGWFCETNTSLDCSIDDNLRCKESCYNLTKYYEKQVLVYNTASEAIVILSKDEVCEIKAYLNAPSIRTKSELFKKLFSLGFIVYEDDNEISKIKYIINQSRYNSENIKSFVIYPTNECNARCFYCFAKEEVANHIPMSEETIENVVHFICNSVSKQDEVIFRWFGGEPLIGADIIGKIIDKFNSCVNNEIKYHSIITTNASLLTKELLITSIEKWHLKKLLIPIDGYYSTHDKRKNYITPQHDSEYGFLKNIMHEALSRGVYIVCRLNLDKNNIVQIDELLEDLAEYNEYPNFYLQATTLHIPEFAVSHKNESYFKYEEMESLYGTIFSKMIACGYLRNITDLFPRRQLSVCEAKLNNHYLISSIGKLFACEQQAQTCVNSIGDCKYGIMHNKALAHWYDEVLDRECEECPFIPICLGGCSYYRNREDKLVSPCVRFKYYYNSVFDLAFKSFSKQK